jgi:hypothetical protein
MVRCTHHTAHTDFSRRPIPNGAPHPSLSSHSVKSNRAPVRFIFYENARPVRYQISETAGRTISHRRPLAVLIVIQHYVVLPTTPRPSSATFHARPRRQPPPISHSAPNHHPAAQQHPAPSAHQQPRQPTCNGLPTSYDLSPDDRPPIAGSSVLSSTAPSASPACVRHAKQARSGTADAAAPKLLSAAAGST